MIASHHYLFMISLCFELCTQLHLIHLFCNKMMTYYFCIGKKQMYEQQQRKDCLYFRGQYLVMAERNVMATRMSRLIIRMTKQTDSKPQRGVETRPCRAPSCQTQQCYDATHSQACCATEPKRELLGCPLFSCWIWVKKNAWRNWCIDTMAKGRDGGLHGVVVEKCFCFGVCLMWWDFCGFGSHSIMHNILDRQCLVFCVSDEGRRKMYKQ